MEFPNCMEMGFKLKTFHGRDTVISGTTQYNFKITLSCDVGIGGAKVQITGYRSHRLHRLQVTGHNKKYL